MRRTSPLLFRHTKSRQENLVQIRGGTFYTQHPAVEYHGPASANPPLFRDLTFEIPATTRQDGRTPRESPHWAIIGKSGATKFLEILRGSHICLPPAARSYPYLSSDEIEEKDHRLRIPSRAIQYVGFNGGKGQGFDSGIRGAYLSARYESRREETDWSVLQYLKGETDLNPADEKEGKDTNSALLRRVVEQLRLGKLLDMPVSNLSNGQTRRSRIARALLGQPELLLLDEPFMGLDPPTLVTLSPILRDLAYRSSPLLLLALRPQDPIPDWITHLIVLGANNNIALKGPKAQVLFSLNRWGDMYNSKSEQLLAVKMAAKMTQAYGTPLQEVGHTLTSKGVVRYMAYEKAKEVRNPRFFKVSGEVFGSKLSDLKREQLGKILETPEEDRTAEDWVMMTSTLPENFEDDGRFSATRQSPSGTDLDSTEMAAGAEAARTLGEPLIELKSVVVKYGDKTVLGHPPPQLGFTEPGLNLTIRRGTRLALLGPNGSGKTTLLSLLTSDHPHSYSLPIQFFGRSRLPQPGRPGLSLWEIQGRIGHSSPEVHGFFPRGLTIRKVLESAWAETFGAKPKLTWERDEMVDAFLRWWEPELRQIWPTVAKPELLEVQEPDRQAWIRSLPSDLTVAQRRKILRESKTHPSYMNNSIWKMMEQSYPPMLSELTSQSRSADADESPLFSTPESDTSLDWAEDTRNHSFGLLPFGTQRLLLLLRAMIKQPDLLVLDEAFSGLSPEVREKAMCWLEHGESVFLQGRMIGRDGQAEEQNTAETGEDDEQEPAVPHDVDAKPKRGRGRPNVGIALRPPSQPGRPPGRPSGSLKGQGPTPWMSRQRQEVAVEGEKRWEVVRVQNMRRTVEAVCQVLDIGLAQLAMAKYNRGPYPLVHNLRWQELVNIARTGRVKDSWPEGAEAGDEGPPELDTQTIEGSAEYRFRGLREEQAMVVVSHVREEVPGVVDEWLRLPGEEEVIESGRSVEMGRCDGGSIRTVEGWSRVWGL